MIDKEKVGREVCNVHYNHPIQCEDLLYNNGKPYWDKVATAAIKEVFRQLVENEWPLDPDDFLSGMHVQAYAKAMLKTIAESID